jgi:SAM-dependent methyltransferase
MQQTEKVQTYFTDRARLFDALYEEDDAASRAFNRVFRRPMFQRYVFTLEGLGRLDGRRILDVGCGSGRYSVELAMAGAEVLGIDFSEEMLLMANERAAEAEVSDRVEFLAGDFIDWAEKDNERYDVAFAMGVLDYVDDAPAFIRMMASSADEVIASFPSPTPVRMPLRKLRYKVRGCPVYFYWKGEIERMFKDAGLRNLDIRRLGFGGYWVHGKR